VPWDGASIGGFMVGEPKDLTWSVLEETTAVMPENKPRYLMGVGTPLDVWEAVERGIDMMDCVFPTRVARNGQIMSRRGSYNITNAFCASDMKPLDPGCKCYVCKTYTRAYLRHLFKAKELAVLNYFSFHNLHFMAECMQMIRTSLAENRFLEAKREFLATYLPSGKLKEAA
jgi:queuine tRNA-ribosyltransferase